MRQLVVQKVVALYLFAAVNLVELCWINSLTT